MGALSFKVIHTDKITGARVGELTLPSGTYQTPIFII